MKAKGIPARKKKLEKSKKVATKKVVRRRDENKEKFLKTLEEMPIVQVAAARTGVHRSTYYRWYAEDPDFKDRADKALQQGKYFVNDMMESLLIKMAKQEKLGAIIFWLKNNHPSYMEIRKYEHYHRHEIEDKSVLTPERMAEIEQVMRAWDKAYEEDYNDSDYDISDEERKPLQQEY